MTSVGIRDLRDNLSRFIRQVEATGKSVTVTDNGRPVAELVPVAKGGAPTNWIEELYARGLAIPPKVPGPIVIPRTGIKLPLGTALALLDEDRGER